MEVVWLLNGDTLPRLRGALRGRTTGPGPPVRVTLDAFVAAIYSEICFGSSAEHSSTIRSLHQARQLVERICILFDLVDIDSTSMIDWISFTDFCVFMRGGESTLQGTKNASGGVGIGGGDGEHDNDITRFAEKLGYVDRSSHCHEIRSMRFVKELDLLIVVEGTMILKIYAAGSRKVGQIEPAIAMRKLVIDAKKRSTRLAASQRKKTAGGDGAGKAKGTMDTSTGHEDSLAVLAAEFIGRDKQAAVSCADGYLTVWELDECRMIRHTRLRDVQVGMRFCPIMDVLISWGVDDFKHEILVWDVDTLKVLHVIDGHSQPVKDVCEVASPLHSGLEKNGRSFDPTLVTSGMDSKVVLWDLRLRVENKKRGPKKLAILVGHYHGVLSLAFSDEHDLILSAGFDFDAICWDRSTNRLYMKLEGHRRSLIGVAVVQHEAQRAVTGDAGGSFRLWDIRRGHSDHGTCLQVFSLVNVRASPRTMVVAWRQGLITAGNKMHVFRAARSAKVEVSLGGAWFSSYTGELCVWLRDAVFVDASTGRIRRRNFQQKYGCEITAFCVDARLKKAVVGDQKGCLRLYDGVTGRWVMSASPHRSEVSALVFMDEDNTFVSVGWDRKIQVHDAQYHSSTASRTTKQTPVGHRCTALLRSVRDAHDGDITFVAASARLGLLATSSNDLTVRLWDYRLLRLEEIIVAHRQEVTCVVFLDPLPCLATADYSGKVFIWATRPHPSARSLLVVLRNTSLLGRDVSSKFGEEKGKDIARFEVPPAPVTSLTFRHTVEPPNSDSSSWRQPKVVVKQVDTTQTEGVGGSSQQARPLSERGGLIATTGGLAVSGMSSMLVTGDEMGTMKVWNLTAILLDKLGALTCGASCTEDKASVRPLSGSRRPHQFVHHRESPLDGVGPQAAIRFKEMIDIAKRLRNGDHVPLLRSEVDGDHGVVNRCTGNSPRAATAGMREGAREHASGSSFQPVDVVTKRSHDRSTATSSIAVQARRRPSTMKRRRESIRDLNGRGLSSASAATFSTAAPNTQDKPQLLRGRAGPREEVETVLNAKVDAMNPVASWVGHSDSIISLQIILDPPSILTASRDKSSRLFSLDGSLLGVVVDENADGQEPWLFRPPCTGRQTEANARGAALHEQLRSVQRGERSAILVGRADALNSSTSGIEDRDQYPHLRTARCDGRAVSDKEPARENEEDEESQGGMPNPAGSHDNGSGKKARRKNYDGERPFRSRSTVSAACIARIKEVTEVRSSHPESCDVSVPDGATAQQSIDARLMSEAREGWGYHLPGSSETPPTASSTGRKGAHFLDKYHSKRSPKRAGGNLIPPQRAPPNLSVEQERKHAKRTRSALDFLSNGITRSAGSLPPGGMALEGTIACVSREDRPIRRRPFTSPGIRSERLTVSSENDAHMNLSNVCAGLSEATRGFCSKAELRHAASTMAPVTALRKGVARGISTCDAELNARERDSARSGPPLSTHRSAMSLMSTRSNAPNSAEHARRMASSRRRRRMDSILRGVRGLVQSDEDCSRPSGVCGEMSQPVDDNRDAPRTGTVVARRGEVGVTVMISTRVCDVISKFDTFVNDEERYDELDTAGKTGGKSPLHCRQRDIRIAARQAAIRHNERYRRAQRFNLVTLQETQQRRQEAMVGLTGPSADRFGPYSLDDVLEFQTFATHLGSHGVAQLTARELMQNPGIKADPYAQALLAELARSRVIRWEQVLSTEDLMQLVFHFAKREETKRITSVLEIALLLERVRDAFLVDKDSLLSVDGNLSYHVVNDIDTTLRMITADSCGSCTTKELPGIMARVGSDVFSHAPENIEAMAAECGVVDAHWELTAADFIAIITKLVLLHHAGRVERSL